MAAIAFLGTIWRFIGGNTLVTYIVIALAAGGSLWGYGAYKHHEGYRAGAAVERAAWVAQRAKDQAALVAAKRAAQDAIDALSNERQVAAQEAKDRQADADLAAAQAASPSKKAICLPRKVGKALNKIGR
jgi:hypothetical protein